MMGEPLDTLDKKWKDTCRILLGEEVGQLSEFKPWISNHPGPLHVKKSSLSGKVVVYNCTNYEGEQFISLDEVQMDKRYTPLNLGQISDFESLAGMLKDRFYYAGNIVLGNSKFNERSSSLSDCFYVYETIQHTGSKHLYRCSYGREDEALFGAYGTGESSFCASCSQLVRVKRSLEACTCTNCSDCYYSYGLENCSDCIFCFHLKSKRYCVGNCQLTREKFEQVKERLLADMRNELRQKKSLPTLFDIARRCKRDIPPLPGVKKDLNSTPVVDKAKIEAEFSSTMKILLGRPLSGIDQYRDWLLEHTHPKEERRSAFSGQRIIMCPGATYIIEIPKDRIVGMEEGRAIGERVGLGSKEAEGITLANAHEYISKMAYFTVDFWAGENSNIIETIIPVDSSDCYNMVAPVYSKLCAYSFWPVRCSAAFGCDTITDSAACVDCYYSKKLSRCFEVDSSRDCTDCYFSHNIENCTECLFCFNVKAKRYAIGNVEMKKEEYLRVKKMVLAEIGAKLEKDKKLDLSIYNIGAQRAD